MQHKGRRIVQWVVLYLFALALVGLGAQFLEMARHANTRIAWFAGWSGVTICTINLGWIVWLHLKMIAAALGRRRAA